MRRLFSQASALCAMFLTLACAVPDPAWAESGTATAHGGELEDFRYPWPVERFTFTSQRQPLQMAYMDVRPKQPNGKVAVLLHGKNFCAATWEETVRVLVRQGYRVIVPDQIGFCKSTKPDNYQFSFGQLARNTHDLLGTLGVGRVVMIGHSTGGMLGVRYALTYPDQVERLVLVNPLGLEDWQAQGIPYQSVDQWYARERGRTADQIRAYEKKNYYADTWRPAFEKWVQMLAGMYGGPGGDAVAWNSARLYDMIFTQPVLYDFPRLSVPTSLLIGDRDISAIGREAAPPAVQAKVGHYSELARAAVAAMPHARLVEFPDLGHAPQIQDPQAFHKALLKEIGE